MLTPSGEAANEPGSRQSLIPIRYNLRSLVRRRTGTLMTVLGVALTVGIFVSVLALVRGLQNTYSDTGDPLNMLVIREGSQSETNSFFDRDVKGIVETMDGVSQLSGEIIILISHPRATGEEANIVVRGVSENAMELRPVMEVIEGRMFRPGLREIIVSQSVSNRFTGAGLGDRMRIGQIDWDVVGLFDARRTVYDSEIWANYDELSGEFERPIYSSLIFSVSDPSAIPALEQRILADRRLQLDVFREIEYFRAQTSTALPIQIIGTFIAVIMAIGSSFAVMNTMYAATAYRTREIATLRMLGFRRRDVLASFFVESLILALAGGVIGCILALPVNGISTGTMNIASFSEVLFEFRITRELLAQGMIFAAVMGVAGGILPGRMAARLPIIRALRT